MQKERLARYSEKQFSEAVNDAYEKLTKNARRVEKPLATLLGGQPGAGKMTLHDILKNRDPNTIVIDADTFREMHPNFFALSEKYSDTVPFTAQFSGKMTEALIDKLSDKRYNLVIEGTLRTTDVPEKTASLLKSKGYTTQLYVMAVSAQESWQGTIDRFNRMKEMGNVARATDKGYHDMIVAALPENLGKLHENGAFDKICLYTREKECVYDSQNAPDINPGEIIKAALEGKPYNECTVGKPDQRTLKEYRELINTGKNVLENMGAKLEIPAKHKDFIR